MTREAISVPAGYVAFFFLHVVTDLVVGSTLYNVPASFASMETFIRFDLISIPLCAIASGYLAASIARRRELMIAALLPILATVMSVALFNHELPLWFLGAEVAETCAGILVGVTFVGGGCVSW